MTMEEEARKPEEQLRNPMTTRWSDADFSLVADTAWQKRLSTSELVRRLVLGALRQDADGGQFQGCPPACSPPATGAVIGEEQQ